MSIETINWAKRQKCGSPSIKAVLMEIANWANPDGRAEFRLVRDIAHVVEMSERNVQRIIARLELGREAGGLELLRRVPVYGESGVQRANGFVLIGFKGRVTDCHHATGKPKKRADGRAKNREGDKLSPTRATDCHREGDTGVTGEGDAGVTPYIDLELEQDTSPPPPRRGEERVGSLSRIPDDWTVPDRLALPPAIAALAALWPDGAYRAEAEAFHQHWRGTGRRKADWTAFWAARVQARHSAVLRDAKAGVSFAPVTANDPAVAAPPVAAKRREDERSTELHQVLEEALGKPMWDSWFARVALVFEDCGLVVVVPSSFHRSHLETNYQRAIEQALSAVGRGVDWTRFVVEPSAQAAPAKSAKSGGKQRA